MKQAILMFALLCILFLGAWDILIAKHEEVHCTINRYHDINSSVEFQTFLGFRISGFVAVDGVEVPKEKYDNVMFLHSLNEVVGYHMQALIITIFIVGGWIGFAILLKDDKNKH